MLTPLDEHQLLGLSVAVQAEEVLAGAPHAALNGNAFWYDLAAAP